MGDDPESRYRVVLGEAPEPAAALPEDDAPFRIAVLGNFSGTKPRKVSAPAGRAALPRPVAIDRDNFEDVISRLKPELHIQLGDQVPLLDLTFSSLDDFHPDSLYERLDLFAELREIRRRLTDPRSFAAAARGLQATTGQEAFLEAPKGSKPEQGESGRKPDVSDLVSGSLLDRAIDETPGRAAAAERPDELRRYVEAVVAPHLVPGIDPRQPQLLAEVDRLVAESMRAILHHLDFQALESAWRALELLVRRLETDSNLKLWLVDVSKEELAADTAAGEDPRSTGLYRLLVEETVGTPGAEPWAVVAGNYRFAATREDVALLGKMARIAAAAGAPFLAAAHPNFVGCESLAVTPHSRDWETNLDPEFAQAWRELRREPIAGSLGLALPRFLLRWPYGRATQPCEQFDFEEFEAAPEHEHYLWGNPVFLCALLLGESFGRSGWQMQPGGGEVGGLPLPIYSQDGESTVKPCAESLLTEATVERILDEGLMPLISLKGRDAVQLVRFQSIASPAQGLAGRWQ